MRSGRRSTTDTRAKKLPRMSTFTTLTALLAVTTAVVIGGLITTLANRAANRRQSPALRLFSYGFGAISLGLFVGGLGALAFGLDGTATLVVQGILVVPGFVLLLRSLYEHPPRSSSV